MPWKLLKPISCSRSSMRRLRLWNCLRERLDSEDRKSTRLNSSHLVISYAVFCLKKKKKTVVQMGWLVSKSTHISHHFKQRVNQRTTRHNYTTPRNHTINHESTQHTMVQPRTVV